MKSFFIKHKVSILIFLIIAEGLFLRTYHLTDWLHFQLDQSRDAFLIKDIIEKGPGELPLLGPRAGGSFLRLGPAYYYIMYVLTLLAHLSHPVVFVLPEILGSVVFVPLFYLLSRRLFEESWSLILTALAINSTFLVTYDRFSWNPNLLPLFSALVIYCWLRYLEEKRGGKPKNALKWIAFAALTVGFIVQMHFVAFVAVPIILVLSAIILGIFYKIFIPALAKKYLQARLILEIGVFLVVFLSVQTPVILNEYISNNTNTQQLFTTVSEKESKDAGHSLSEKLIQNLWVYPKGYFISITGVDVIDYPVWNLEPEFDIVCNEKCRKSFVPTVFASIVFLFSGLIFTTLLVKNTKEIIGLKNRSSRQNRILAEWEFIVFLTVWMAIPWWSFYSLSFTLRPRFFLISVVPFWIITGLLLRQLTNSTLGKKTAIGLVVLLLTSNMLNTIVRFDRLAGAEAADLGVYPQDQILFQDESYPVVLSQQKEIADWIIEKSPPDTPYVFLWAPSYYYRPIMYLMDDSIYGDKVRYMSSYPQVPNASYFAVSRTSKPEKFFHGVNSEIFQVTDYHVYGTLTVYKLELTEKGLAEAKSREKKFFSNKKITDPERIKRKCLEKPKASCRYTWNDIL